MIFIFISLLTIAHGLPVGDNQEVDDVGSDAPMFNAGFYGGDMAGFNPDTRNAIIKSSQVWPGGVIPYVIDGSLSGSVNLIEQAMEHFHQVTCIRFRPRTNERDYINIKAENGCWSSVGRNSGRQELSLGRECLYRGVIIHELLHAVGFWHEQNRPDRDDYLIVYHDNIKEGERHGFIQFGYHQVEMFGEPYDVTSIMQYGEYASAKDRSKPTMKARSGERIIDAWNKNSMSASDIRRVNYLYKCQ